MTAPATRRYASWRDEFESRKKSPAEALEVVQNGHLVGLGILCPGVLTQALLERARQLERVDIRCLAPREVPLFSPDGPKGEKEIELFIGDALRPAHDQRIATYLPNTFMLGFKAFDAGRPEARIPDVFLVAVSPPNEKGYVNFGPHMWHKKAYVRRCRHTIAAIDPNIQPVYGDTWIHVSEIETFVDGYIKPVDIPAVRQRIETQAPPENRDALLRILNEASPDQVALVEDMFHLMPPGILEQAFGLSEVDPAAQAIAEHLKTLIRDGDTIQVGVGQPSSLMFKAGAFDHAHDLGLHTELGSPGLARLWEKGVLTGARKSIHKGRAVATAWTGCDGTDLRIIADNPAFELYDSNYLLNPLLMAQNRQMTSINSAIAVDLLGQVASEDRFGGHMVNGTGGQPDAHLSAALCPDGRAITVLRSTALEGTVSKIVAQHPEGTLVTVPRYLADTVITEYGIARLLDKNHRQRAEELIAIAHPDFRAELREKAKQLWGTLE